MSVLRIKIIKIKKLYLTLQIKLYSMLHIRNRQPKLSRALLCQTNKVSHYKLYLPGPGCSKLTMSLVNISLKFQTLLSQVCQYFLLKKM